MTKKKKKLLWKKTDWDKRRQKLKDQLNRKKLTTQKRMKVLRNHVLQKNFYNYQQSIVLQSIVHKWFEKQ